MLNEIRSAVESSFQEQFSRPHEYVVAAPGRVNLIGEHIDYNDGFVLPMAIERYVVVAAGLAADSSRGFATVHSTDLDQTATIPLGKSNGPTVSGWGKYLEGVVAGFAELGTDVPAFDAVIGSSVPQGGGLSSSAALEVATATLLESISGHMLSQLDKAMLCQRAEHQFAGVPCGIMDQFSSVFGQADQLMLIDCRSQECEMVPLDASGVSVLIINSNVKHELTGGEYAERRSQCEQGLSKLNKTSWRDVTMPDVDAACELLGDVEFRRARHVVGEIERTRQAASSFRNGDWDSVGQLMYASHDSLRDDFEVSCAELDTLVDIAVGLGKQQGMIGSRMTGGGFGGSTVSLVEDDKLSEIIEHTKSRYKQLTGIQCDCFASRPAKGAHVLS